MVNKECGTCFYSELDDKIHPCNDCADYDKWVNRSIFIREAAKPLSEAIKEWVDFKEEVDVVSQPPHYTKHPSGIECIFEELKEALKRLDEVSLLELLGIQSDDLVERFDDVIEKKQEYLIKELD